MTITGYKRLTVALTLTSLLFLAFYVEIKFRWYEGEIEKRNVYSTLALIDSARSQALFSSDSESVAISLMMVLESTNALTTDKHLNQIYERERRHAAADILAHLRSIAGKDYGDDPQAWIDRFVRKHNLDESAQPKAAHEPPPAAAVQQPSGTINPTHEGESSIDGGGW